MNRNPNPSDEVIDDALLNEALAEPTPAELEAKILALTDPAMLSLLDEALAPEAPSDQLTQRILAATTAQLTGDATNVSSPRLAGSEVRRASVGGTQPAVLARIGPSTYRYAAAAAIALAVGLGIYFLNQDPANTGNSIAKTPDTSVGTQDGASPATPDWLVNEQVVSNTDYFGSATDPIQAALDNVADSLDNVTITRDTLWAELDAYEAFLDEIES